jgi:hypothetical protein
VFHSKLRWQNFGGKVQKEKIMELPKITINSPPREQSQIKMIEKLRSSIEKAINLRSYSSGLFLADKLTSLSGEDEDFVTLARIHFALQNYSNTVKILLNSSIVKRNCDAALLAGQACVRLLFSLRFSTTVKITNFVWK